MPARRWSALVCCLGLHLGHTHLRLGCPGLLLGPEPLCHLGVGRGRASCCLVPWDVAPLGSLGVEWREGWTLGPESAGTKGNAGHRRQKWGESEQNKREKGVRI